jgi:ubiquitin C
LEPRSISINVQTPDGKTHTVEVTPSDTSDTIKTKIAAVTGMKVAQQVLKSQGKELPSDGSTVKDMGIRDGSALTVELKQVPITVNTIDGKKIKVMVDPTNTMSDIKKQLEDEAGVPAKNQRLSMNGEELSDDNKTAADYGIKPGSELDLEPKSIKITVETPDGKTHTVQVSPSDTSDNIKAKIAEVTGMAAPQQLLKVLGKELPSDGSTVKDMGIRDGSALTVEFKKVPITVNTIDGKKIKVMVDPTNTISDIKKQLEGESGLPSKNQRLFLKGEELMDDKKTAADYGIEAGSELDLEPKSIEITVETPDGKTHTVEVTPSDTSDTIKTKIAAVSGMVVPRQVLIFEGKKLPSDGSTVKDMGIRDGSALTVDIYKVLITVETSDGKTVSLDVEPSDTIDVVKKMIQKETGIEPKKQLLKLGEEELKNGRSTVDECGIKAGSTLTLEQHADPIIFVDIRSGTLFAVDRAEVIEKNALTPHQNNKLDFTEAAKDSIARGKILQLMKDSPALGVATQVVVTQVIVEDYELENAGGVASKWGVNLKKREKNKKGEEFLFVDPKTGATGELSRKKYVDMKFITPVTAETIEESEKDTMKYEKYISDIRNVFGVKSAT